MLNMYYIYHIPGKKIGVTRNLKNRVEVMQGYAPDEYQVLYQTTNIDDVSDKEIELQKVLGYKVDNRLYKEVINSKPELMKLNITEQTTTFPCPKNKVKGRLMDMLGHKWETAFGKVELTKEVVTWIDKNCVTSMYDKERCFVYNKALYEAFNLEDSLFDNPNPSIYDLIRDWAEERGIYANGDEKTQYVKLMEEAGELAQALLKQDAEETRDAIGDMVVVLTNLAHLCGMSIENCVATAYAEIAERRGKMVNGTFVKEQL